MFKFSDNKINVIKTFMPHGIIDLVDVLRQSNITDKIQVVRGSETVLKRYLRVAEKGDILLFLSHHGISYETEQVYNLNIATCNKKQNHINNTTYIINRRYYTIDEVTRYFNNYDRLRKINSLMK